MRVRLSSKDVCLWLAVSFHGASIEGREGGLVPISQAASGRGKDFKAVLAPSPPCFPSC